MFSQVSVCPQGGLSRSLSGGGGSVKRGSLSRGVSGREGVSVRERPPEDRDTPMVTSGQYASYWDAFFL